MPKKSKDVKSEKKKKGGNKKKNDIKQKQVIKENKKEAKKQTKKLNKSKPTVQNKKQTQQKSTISKDNYTYVESIANVKKLKEIAPKSKDEKTYFELTLKSPENYKILLDKSGIKKLIDYGINCIYVNSDRVIVNYKDKNGKQLKNKLTRIIMNMKTNDNKLVKLIKPQTSKKQDLRKDNLKIVSQSENVFIYNIKNKKHSGINFSKRKKKYEVTISAKGKRKHLGYFDNLQEALRVRRDAEWKHYKHIIKLFAPEKVKLYK